MESLKLNHLKTHCSVNEIAVIQHQRHGSYIQISYKSLFDLSNDFKRFLEPHLTGHNCIGLLMEKNILVPAIVICLQELKQTFIFGQRLEDFKENVHWILTFPQSVELPLKAFWEFAENERLTLHNFNDSSMEPNEIFCIISTSGSTGDKKIVEVPCKCIESNVKDLNEHFQVGQGWKIYWGTPLSFDPSLVELILALTNGATLVIFPELVHLDSNRLLHELIKEKIDFLQMVPSVFLRWSEQQICDILSHSSLKVLALGGETFPDKLSSFPKKSDLKLYNLYGLTELSCWTSIEQITDHIIPSLGTPLGDTLIQLKDDGEICISSQNRYCIINGTKSNLVDTGDLGLSVDGKIYYLGRKMREVKRFGHKLALYRIEDIIYKETSLRSRLVFVNNKILGFVLIEERMNEAKKIRTLDKLRVKILNTLSEECIPDYLDIVTYFPLNENGKICDKSLIKLYESSQRTNLTIDEVFLKILNYYLRVDCDKFRNSTFLELGGNSILIVQLIQALEDRLEAKIPENFVQMLVTETIDDCVKFVTKVKLEVTTTKHSQTQVIENHVLKEIWKYDLKGCVDASPIAFNWREKFYVACGSFAHRFVILTEDGGEFFSHTFPDHIHYQPVFKENSVFVSCSNKIYSINLESRKFVWDFQTDSNVSTNFAIAEDSIAFSTYSGNFYNIYTKDGTLKFQLNLSNVLKIPPVFHGNNWYVANISGEYFAINRDGNVIWQGNFKEPVTRPPCIIDDGILWVCGSEILNYMSVDGIIVDTYNFLDRLLSSPIRHQNGFLLIGSENLYFGKLNKSKIEISTKTAMDTVGHPCTSPFLYENFLISTNETHLYFVDVSTQTVKSYLLPAESFSSPFCLNNQIYVGCRDNYLYAYFVKT